MSGARRKRRGFKQPRGATGIELWDWNSRWLNDMRAIEHDDKIAISERTARPADKHQGKKE
jgi:hypothetical protein